VFESTLFALPFDPNSLELRGGPVPVVPDVRRAVGADIGIAQYAVSESGTLVYVKGRANDQVSLALADRAGMFKPLPAPSDNVYHPRFNHDESRIAVYRLDGATTSNVWIYEVAQSQWRQLTFNGGDRPLWTPDGRAITYRVGTSLWQIPHASTFTRTCAGPGSGTSRSTTSQSPAALLICAAFIFPIMMCSRPERLHPSRLLFPAGDQLLSAIDAEGRTRRR